MSTVDITSDTLSTSDFASRFHGYPDAFRREGKAEFFSRLVFDEIANLRRRGPLTIVDIGCGGGFHHRPDIQHRIGEAAQRYIGVEPDPDATVQDCFEAVHRCGLEDAPIEPNCVDLAFAVMVLEHVADADRFFARLGDMLRPGGVFLGFTVDARHWFTHASALLQRTRLKDRYLDLLIGRRGTDRYENFPTHYRCNDPATLARLASQRFHVDCLSLHKIGQVDYYLPRALRPLSHLLDRMTISRGWPGSVLVVRLEKLGPR